jgi:hypothetical protein
VRKGRPKKKEAALATPQLLPGVCSMSAQSLPLRLGQVQQEKAWHRGVLYFGASRRGRSRVVAAKSMFKGGLADKRR